MDDPERLLNRSDEFAEFLLNALTDAQGFSQKPRHVAAESAVQLVFEHAHSLRLLFLSGAPSSAIALLRLQYEALLRASWLLYAATDVQVEKATAPLTIESAAAAKNLPGAAAMLEALERTASGTPGLDGLVQPLREIRDSAWTPMNAFVHCGLHALGRTAEGFPVALMASVVKMSNGMLHMAARLLARLTGERRLLATIETGCPPYSDVLPVIVPPVQ